jgi:predicted transcriptional regulator
MENRDNIIISIHPQYACKIDSGKKVYEVRTRKLNIQDGTRVWIYRTLPDACVSSTAIVQTIIAISPAQAWKKYSKTMCIAKKSFDSYTKGRKVIYLLKISDVKPLKKALTLAELRKKIPPFFPPQFFKKLNPKEEIQMALLKEFAPVRKKKAN